MRKRTSFIIGFALVLIAIIFMIFAFLNPESTFPWSLRITYMFYGLYIWFMFRFLLVIPVFQRMKSAYTEGSIMRIVIYLLMAIVFFLMEITWDKVDIFTVMRGFIVTGSVDVVVENIYLLYRNK